MVADWQQWPVASSRAQCHAQHQRHVCDSRRCTAQAFAMKVTMDYEILNLGGRELSKARGTTNSPTLAQNHSTAAVLTKFLACGCGPGLSKVLRRPTIER